MTINYHEFPACMYVIAEAMHQLNIDHEKVKIVLPEREWKTLLIYLEHKMSGFVTHTRRVDPPLNYFRYLGFVFEKQA